MIRGLCDQCSFAAHLLVEDTKCVGYLCATPMARPRHSQPHPLPLGGGKIGQCTAVAATITSLVPKRPMTTFTSVRDNHEWGERSPMHPHIIFMNLHSCTKHHSMAWKHCYSYALGTGKLAVEAILNTSGQNC